LSTALDDHKDILSRLTARRDKLQKQMSNLVELIAKIEKQRAVAENELEVIKKQEIDLQSAASDLQGKANAISQQCADLETEVAKVNLSHQNSEQEAQKLEREKEDLTTQLQELEANALKITDDFSAKDALVEQLLEKVKVAQEKQETQHQRLIKLEDSAAERDRQLNIAKENQVAEGRKLMGEIAELRATLQIEEEKVASSVQVDLTKLQFEHLSLATQINETEKTKNELEETVTGLQVQLEQVTQATEKVEAKLASDLSIQRKETAESLRHLRGELERKRLQREQLQEEIVKEKSSREEAHRTNTMLKEKQEKLYQTIKDNQEVEAKFNPLNLDYERQTSILKAKEEEIQSLRQIQTEKLALEEEIQTLRANAESDQNSLSAALKGQREAKESLTKMETFLKLECAKLAIEREIDESDKNQTLAELDEEVDKLKELLLLHEDESSESLQSVRKEWDQKILDAEKDKTAAIDDLEKCQREKAQLEAKEKARMSEMEKLQSNVKVNRLLN
jgi:hypothetical protein